MTRPILKGLLPALLVTAVLASACGSSDDSRGSESSAPSSPPADTLAITVSSMKLTGGASSQRELIDSAFRALETLDTAALAGMMITREEFDQIIYPEYALHYPIARDPRPEVKKLVATMHFESAAKGFRRLLGNYGGHHFDRDSVEFRDGVKQFRSYVISEGTVIHVRDDKGDIGEFTAFGSIIERNGRFKFMSYRDRGV